MPSRGAPRLRYNCCCEFALKWVASVLGEINGPSKEAKSEEAEQAAALDDDRLEAIKVFGGAAQGVRDSPSAASHGARCSVEGSHRGDIPRDEMTPPAAVPGAQHSGIATSSLLRVLQRCSCSVQFRSSLQESQAWIGPFPRDSGRISPVCLRVAPRLPDAERLPWPPAAACS